MYEIEYATQKERNEILEAYKEKFLICEKIYINGSFLTFSDKKDVYVEDIAHKIDILKTENKILKVEQTQQNDEILVNMLANTEMFEMLLGMIPSTYSIEKNNVVSSMIEVYTTLIIKGVKIIEDVPVIIRTQVAERLRQLEVPVK